MDDVMLAMTWNGEDALQGYHLSEKMDGQRALYFVKENKFFSRLRHEIVVDPKWREQFDKDFADYIAYLQREKLPIPEFLDGELWAGRKQFQRTQSIVRRTTNIVPWTGIKFVVFDVPHRRSMGGTWGPHVFPRDWLLKGHDQWHEMVKGIPDLSLSNSDRVMWSPNYFEGTFWTAEQLIEMAKNVVDVGGEGLMARKAKATWKPSRTSDMLKILPLVTAPATIHSIIQGEGRGSLFVHSNEVDKHFKVGTGFTDDEWISFRAGQEIMVAWRELTDAGVPKGARYVRE